MSDSNSGEQRLGQWSAPSTSFRFVWLAPLNDISMTCETGVGAKAANLARLSGQAFPVPAAFCIPAAAYWEHLETSGLGAEIRKTLRDLNSTSDSASMQSSLANIRHSIIGSLLSKDFRVAIESALPGLSTDLVAVRSSALGEDSAGHSFAGQFDTFLAVKGLPAILDAVKGCWASLWSDRSFQYRTRKGISHTEAAMAVIIQAQVMAETSGIAFSVDPAKEDVDRVVIEAAWGLGEAIVQGKVTPDRFVLSRSDLAILSIETAVKKLAVMVGENGGVQEENIDAAKAQAACLDDTVVRAIADLALRAEKAFQQPQDVEWALTKGKIWILQSRPITALGSLDLRWSQSEAPGLTAESPSSKLEVRPSKPDSSFEDRQVWSNLNTGEVLPDVVSPMTWSRIDGMLHDVFGTIIRQLGMEFGDSRLADLVAGRVYFNLNTLVALIRRIPGVGKVDVGEMLGGAQGSVLRNVKFADEDLPHLNFSLLRTLVNLPRFLLWTLSHSPHRGLQKAATMRRRAATLQQLNPQTLSEDEIMAYLYMLLDDRNLITHAIAYGGGALLFLPPFFGLCRRWLRDEDASIANRLLAGLGGMDSAEAGLDLWRLAEVVRKNPAVENVIFAEDHSKDGVESLRIRLPGVAGGTAFLAAWDAFMAKHGHHCRGEIELVNQRWREMPGLILAMVRGYLKRLDQANPVALHERHTLVRRDLSRQCRRQLADPFRRTIFEFLLKNAQRACVVRENLKSEIVRLWALGRSLLLELGQRLYGRGALKAADDIFFLNFDELRPIQKGRPGFDVIGTVARRRTEYEANRLLSPPAVVVGRCESWRTLPAASVSEDHGTGVLDNHVLRGLAVSPGVVTGPARVVLRADTRVQVLPGEILVAPFTDPGWTPYFLQAAAIVTELGGLLSHGSIIAREYGIPAVVNIGPATGFITTGQMLEVDGNRGEVRILPGLQRQTC
jgi:pyruvate,water dikinase